MNSCTSVAVKGQSIGLVTASVDGKSQSPKEVTNYIPWQMFRKVYFQVIHPLVQTDWGQ